MLRVLFSVWQNFDPPSKYIMQLGQFSLFKWPNIEQIIFPPGRIVLNQ